MELTGKVELDAKSLESLEENLHEKWMQSFLEGDMNSEDIEKLLTNLNFTTYYDILTNTIDKILDNRADLNTTFKSDLKKLKCLRCIQLVLKLSTY